MRRPGHAKRQQPALKLRLGHIKHGRWSKRGADLQNGAPEEKKKDLMPAAWFEAWSAATLATDPVGAKQTPPVVRTPNGSVQDTREYWLAGKPLWEPSEVKAPTLIVVGEWDAGTPVTGAQAVFGKLTNTPYKRLVQIGEGTHLRFPGEESHASFSRSPVIS